MNSQSVGQASKGTPPKYLQATQCTTSLTQRYSELNSHLGKQNNPPTFRGKQENPPTFRGKQKHPTLEEKGKGK